MPESMQAPTAGRSLLRPFTVLLIAFFLTVIALTGLAIFPQIDKALNQQHAADSEHALDIELLLVKRYLQGQQRQLADFARYPSIRDALAEQQKMPVAGQVLRANPALNRLLTSVDSETQRSDFILRDQSGRVVYQSHPALLEQHSQSQTLIKQIVEAQQPYYVQLLGQQGGSFRYAMTVPVYRAGVIAGMLSAEITAPMRSLFSHSLLQDGIGFRLSQGETVIETDTRYIRLAQEISKRLADTDITLTYISDRSVIVEARQRLRITVLTVLLAGLVVSFVLFSVLGFDILSKLGKSNRATEPRISSRHAAAYSLPVMVGLLGLVASVAGALIVNHLQNQQYSQASLASNKVLGNSVKQSLQGNLRLLDVARGFFESSASISRRQFEIFFEPMLADYPNVKRLLWMPYVASSERADFESQAQRTGMLGYQIVDIAANGQRTRAADRASFYPLYYSAPAVRPELQGIALDSLPGLAQRIASIEQSTGQFAIQQALIWPNDKGQEPGLLILDPVYSASRLIGFVGILIDDQLLMEIFEQDPLKAARLRIVDVSDAQAPKQLFPPKRVLSDPFQLSAAIDPALITTSSVEMAGRIWQISIYPDSMLQRPSQSFPYLVFVSGAAITSLVVYILIHFVRRRNIIEHLVEARTREIEESKHFQELVMRNMPDLLFVKDDQFRIVDANPAFMQLYPANMQQRILGYTTYEAYSADEADEFLANDKRALDEGSSEVEESILFPDGIRRTLLTRKVRFEDSAGQRFILGIARDISEVRATERDREALRSAMENTVEGVALIGLDGCYSYVNEAYASICGRRADQMLGMEWQTTVHEDDRPLMARAYQRMLTDGKVVAEPRGIRPDGSIFYKQVTMISKTDERGSLLGHHCFISDITARKSDEEELLRSNQELEDFAFIASHDLKEPLRGLYNHARLLEEDYLDSLDTDGQHKIKRIMYLAKRMERLIGDLLNYSKLGRGAEALGEVDLKEVVEDVVETLADHAGGALDVTVGKDLPTVMGDKTRITELYRNLITNAVKYNDSETKRIEVGVQIDHSRGDADGRVFFVRDNGIGIDPQFHNDIFKIFKRLHKKDAYGGGTGAGLTFIRKIVAAHGGRVWLESQLGEGTTFFFTLYEPPMARVSNA